MKSRAYARLRSMRERAGSEASLSYLRNLRSIKVEL
jgi:hypothetical protein